MSTMNVSLPDELKSYVDDQVGGGAYGSTSEYMRDLIRRDMDRQLRSRAADDVERAVDHDLVRLDVWRVLHSRRDISAAMTDEIDEP